MSGIKITYQGVTKAKVLKPSGALQLSSGLIPGPAGPIGPAGQGVPAGGSINQVLTKLSSANYDTAWVDPTSGGTPGGANTQIQFNTAGAFDGDPNFTWNKFLAKFQVTGTSILNGPFNAIGANASINLNTNDITLSVVANNAILTSTGYKLSYLAGTGNRILRASATGDISAALLSSGEVTTALGFTPLSTITGIAAGGELTGTYANPSLSNAAVIGKVLTGYVSGAGTISATDSILSAIQKLNGNIAGLPGGYITSVTSPLTVTGTNLAWDFSVMNNWTGKQNFYGNFEVGTNVNGVRAYIFTEDRVGFGSLTNAGLREYPASGTNVAASFAIFPKGTGGSSTYKTAFGIWNTDFVVDGINFEACILSANGANGYTLGAYAGGTGAKRQIILDVNTVLDHTNPAGKQVSLLTDGTVGINNATASGYMLSVTGNGSAIGVVRAYSPTAAGVNGGSFFYASSTIATAADQRLGGMVIGGGTATSSSNCAVIAAYSSEAHGGTGGGTYLSFFNTATGAAGTFTERLRLVQDGTVLIQNLAGTGSRFVVTSSTGVLSPVDLFGGNNTWTGTNTHSNAVILSGNRSLAAWGINGPMLAVAANTLNDTSSTTGTVASNMINSFGIPTLTATNTGIIYTNAATVFISGSPVASTNVTVTNAYSLYVAAGFVNFQARLFAMGGVQTGTNSTTSNFFGGPADLAGGSSSTASILFGGITAVQFRAVFSGSNNAALVTGTGYANVIVGASPISTFTSGTHPWLANMVITQMGTVTNAGATVTNSASMYIGGISAGGTNKYGLYINADALGVTPGDSFAIKNTTAAAVGAQQISGSITLEGQGWKTTATAASQAVTFRQYVLPVQGAAAPSGEWHLQYSVAGGSYTDVLMVTSLGQVAFAQFSAPSNKNYIYTDANGFMRLGGPSDGAININITTGSSIRSASTRGADNFIAFTGVGASQTSGESNMVSVSEGFVPTSGTGTYNALRVNSTINQTGGANGITRGLYINPTLTAAADYRAIEIALGKVVLAAGVAARAPMIFPLGVAPTSPVDGDIWLETNTITGFKMRLGGVTRTFTLT